MLDILIFFLNSIEKTFAFKMWQKGIKQEEQIVESTLKYMCMEFYHLLLINRILINSLKKNIILTNIYS